MPGLVHHYQRSIFRAFSSRFFDIVTRWYPQRGGGGRYRFSLHIRFPYVCPNLTTFNLRVGGGITGLLRNQNSIQFYNFSLGGNGGAGGGGGIFCASQNSKCPNLRQVFIGGGGGGGAYSGQLKPEVPDDLR